MTPYETAKPQDDWILNYKTSQDLLRMLPPAGGTWKILIRTAERTLKEKLKHGSMEVPRWVRGIKIFFLTSQGSLHQL